MRRFLVIFVVLTFLLAGTIPASAGWVTIKNETDQPIVVQETVEVNNRIRHGKPVKLMPGEVFREFQALPGSKTVRVMECSGKKRTLCTSELTWKLGDQSFAVRSTVDGVDVAAATATTAAKADVPRRK